MTDTTIDGLILVHTTDMAMLVKFDGDDDEDGVWLPISQIRDTDLSDPGDEGFVEIPEWLADDKGLA